MKYTRILLLIITLLFNALLMSQEKKIGTLQGDSYFKIPILLMDDQKIFIVDKVLLKGFIYDRKTLVQIAEFGGKGEAPSQFLAVTGASIDDKHIYVSCFPKLCIFTKEGKFVKEFRIPMNTGQFKHLGNNRFLATYYCSSRPDDKNLKFQYQLYDNNVLFNKDFFTSEFPRYFKTEGDTKINYFPKDSAHAEVYKNNIYFGNTAKGFYFAVFNRDGKQLYEIKLNVPKELISKMDRKSLERRLSSGLSTNEGYTFKTKNIIQDYYPAYNYFYVNDDRIYVFTHVINWKTTIYIMDLKGENMRKKEVMHVFFSILPIGNESYVHKGKLYYLKENQLDPDAGTELFEFDLLK